MISNQSTASGKTSFIQKLQLRPNSYQGLRFCLYAVLILLLNAAIAYFPLRVDLTEQQTYSLAPASTSTLAQLEEPVTIRAYLSSNLPSRYNILSSLLRDLLQSYRSNAKRDMFSYSVNLIHSDDKSEKTLKLQKEAEKYGIYPVQLQGVDGNEFKAVSAYIGLVITQGENQEILTPLQPEDNIQYKITAALQRMSRKGSALLSMSQNLKIYYYFSPLIAQINNGKYSEFPNRFQQVMESTREQLYDRVDSEVVDPDKLPPGLPEPGELDDLPETEITGPEGKSQKVYSALVIDSEGRYKSYSLLQLQPTLQLGPDGLKQSNTINVIDPLQLEGQLSEIAISSLGIAQNVGYISDRETASFNPPSPQQPGQGANLYQFSQDARDLYNFEPVKLDEGIGKDVNILMLVDPKQQLSEWDIYQIDQFVMRGGRLIVAMEPYQVMQNPYGYGAQFIPNLNIEGVKSDDNTNPQYTLIDLLRHYGIEYQNAMLFDKHSFINRGQDRQTGGYQETQVYYIPEIDMQWGSEQSFIKGLKKLYSYNSAPLIAVEGDDDRQEPLALLKSSPEAWTEDMSDEAKDPNNVMPPAADKLSQQSLIMATQGPLTSFFKGKEIPKKPAPEEKAENSEEQANEETNQQLSLSAIQDAFIAESERGQVLVSGSSLIFDERLLSVPTNKALALNLLDYMAGNIEMADLRARSGVPNFIDDKIGNGQKNVIKWFNVLGLPFMVGILGLLMLMNWRQRQLQLRNLFAQLSPAPLANQTTSAAGADISPGNDSQNN